MDKQRWEASRRRVLARDGNRCTVGWLLGGDCDGRLHIHHIVPRDVAGDPYDVDNLATVCARHHPHWERLARSVRETRQRPRPNQAAYRRFAA